MHLIKKIGKVEEIPLVDGLLSSNDDGEQSEGDECRHPDDTAAGECVQYFRDEVVGSCSLQQFAFGNPSHGCLVACHLHPDGVDGVARNGFDGSHGDDIIFIDKASVHDEVTLTGNQFQRVCLNKKVEILGNTI